MAVELPACLFHFQSTHILHGRFSSNGFDDICQCVLIGAKCGDYIIAVNVSIGQVIIGEQILLQSNNQILLFAGRCKQFRGSGCFAGILRGGFRLANVLQSG